MVVGVVVVEGGVVALYNNVIIRGREKERERGSEWKRKKHKNYKF